MKVHIHPALSKGPDPGNGGIGRVILGQHQQLPALGWELTDDPAQADVIACHIEIPESYLRLYPHKPFVLHNHGNYWSPDYDWQVSWPYASNKRALESMRAADVITAVSEWTGHTLRRHLNRDVRVVEHGVDLDEWQVPTDAAATFYVLWNKTRVDPICDPAPLNAVAALMPDVQFVTTHGEATPNVVVTDTLPFEEGKRYVEQAGVYLCTTRETFGIGTIEALACGVPIVGYRWGGQAEIVTHGVDGWLAEPGDVAGLAEGIRWAQARRAALVAPCREKAEHFPTSRSAEQYAEIYSELAERYAAERPKVSVIVPAYNMGDYLRDALASVRDQSLQDWECIVVNDASPDPRDHEIAQDYVDTDPRFREIVKPQNEYLAAARNTGIEASRGQYILPLDADDMIAPNALEILADVLDRDRATHVVYGGVYFVGEDGGTPENYGHPKGPGYSGWPVDFTLRELFEREGQPGPYSSMYRREVWELTGGYRTRCRTSEDQDFWLRIGSYGFRPRMVTEAPLLTYRVREGSMSGTQGWANHRDWYPWIKDYVATPAGAYRGDVDGENIPYPALDPPRVAVIIPVGPGHAKYVLDAIDSVDAQTFRQWECIVANDTGALLPNLPQWVRVIDGPFGGVAAARNAAITASRAPLFLPLDADDYLQPRALELMLAAHDEMLPDLVSVYSDFFEDPDEPGKFKVWQTPDWSAHHLHTTGLGYAVTTLTPKAYWAEVGGYDASLPGWEDWAFALSLAGKGHCSRRVPAPLFTYRKHTGERAGANMADFDAAKAAIMRKDFGAASDGELMACGSCGAKATSMAFPNGQAGPSMLAAEGQMIEYTGTKSLWTITGNVGPEGQPKLAYRVQANRPKFYVMKWDVAKFVNLGEFRVVSDVPSDVGREPVLVAAGAPAVSASAPVAVAEPAPVPAAPAPVAEAAPAPAPAPTPPPIAEAAASAPEAAAESDSAVPEGWLTEPQMVAMSRVDLDAYAKSKGISNPETLPNKTAVAKAVIELKAMFGS